MINFGKKRGLLVLAGLAICLTLMITPAYAKKIFKLAHGDIEDPYLSPDAAAAIVFKSLVDSGTNGEVEVQIFPGLVLGKERELMEQLKNNLIQGNLASVGGMAPFWPLVGVLDTPFAAGGDDHFHEPHDTHYRSFPEPDHAGTSCCRFQP